MTDYDAVYRVLYGIRAAITEIEKRNYGNARRTPSNARRVVLVFLEAGDMENPVLKELIWPEEGALKH